MAYVDGIAPENVVQHIRHCPACTQEAEALSALQATMRIKLHRYSCLRTEQLISYLQDELTGNEKMVASQHLRKCPHCKRELAKLTRDRKTNLRDQIRSAFETLEATLVTPQLKTSPVRGETGFSASEVQVYRAEDIEILLAQQSVGPPAPLREISGLIHSAGQVPEGIEWAVVALHQNEILVAESPVSPRGQFEFTRLEPASYDLNLVWDQYEVQLKSVKVL